MSPILKNILKYSLFAGIAGFFIYMAFKNVDPAKVWNDIKNADFMWIAFAWMAGMLSNVSRALRWVMIAEPLGYQPKKWTSFHGVMVGYLVNFAIPRGGEVTRAAMISRSEKIPLPTMIGSIVAERVMDLVFMGLVLLLAFVVQFETIKGFFTASNEQPGDAAVAEGGPNWTLIIVGILAVLGVLFLLLMRRLPLTLQERIKNLKASFVDGIKGILKVKSPLMFVFHSLVIWIMYFLQVYFCFFAIPETSHLGLAAGLTTLVVSTIAVLLPAPGGIGTFHFFVPIGLTLYGITPDNGLTYATIAQGSQMLMFVVFGTISLITMITLQRKALAE